MFATRSKKPHGKILNLLQCGFLIRVVFCGGRKFWHNLMGLWLDAEENVYVAVLGARKVKKVSRDGRVEVVARSSAPWSPTGGFVAPNGDLWLLEYGGGFAARARRIGRDGTEKIF
jgi:hypothetical protein